MVRILLSSMILLAVAVPPGAAAAAPSEPPAALAFGAWRIHVSTTLGIALEVPDEKAAPVAVRERSYPSAEPGVHFEHDVVVADGRVRVEVFRDLEKMPLAYWFERKFGFLVDGEALVWTTKLRSGEPAVVVEQPASPQTRPRRTTALRLGDWTLLVTCEGLDEPDHVTLCDAVVHSLRPARREELWP